MGTPLLDPPACFSGELPGHYNLLSNTSPSILLPPPTSSALSFSLKAARGACVDAAPSHHPCKRRAQATLVMQPAPRAATTGITRCYSQHHWELEQAAPELRRHAAVCWNQHHGKLQPTLQIAATSSLRCYDQQRVAGIERELLKPTFDRVASGKGDARTTTR
ncbi:uncharacterized protein LOC119336517 [Triticum dicoccoides]|uniref:uncharacterized protein LOC119336517 n=1 Tax=Triticum dicoccoides TaxID=85692 RepID=UPI0018919578|nr:uncharacterized protein LOC119336517 [Triticum dicoccoides]